MFVAAQQAKARRSKKIREDDEDEYVPPADEEEEEWKEPPSVRRVQSQRTPAPPPQPPATVSSAATSTPRALSFPPRPTRPSSTAAATGRSPPSTRDSQLSDLDFTGDPTATAPKQAEGNEKGWNDRFLQPEYIKDASGKRPNEPGYNPRTLHVPADVYRDMSGAQQQYFDIKSQYYDVVLFYKIGKFYEMYDHDAEIGVRVLGLNYMANQTRPHAGFPEAALDKYMALLIAAGYKVGRVEQTQTPEDLRKDKDKGMRKGKQKNVVGRDLFQIYTQGTLMDLDLIQSYAANYFMSLTENVLTADECQQKREAGECTALGGEIVTRYGVCYLEASIGAFTCGEFYDDQSRTQLATILATLNPLEIAYPLDTLSDETMLVFRNELSTHAKKQPWVLERDSQQGWRTAEETWQWLDESGFFKRQRDEHGVALPPKQQEVEWPVALDDLMEQRATLAFEALGGCCRCLERLKTAERLLTQRNFSLYTAKQAGRQADNMILDQQTLANLEVMRAKQNEADTEGGVKGSLLDYVDQCQSPAGHRLIKRWLSLPLANIKAIMDRQNAVSFLLHHRDTRADAKKLLKQLPDLERQLSSVHSYSIRKPKREVLYGDQEKKKLRTFRQLVGGLQRAQEVRTRVFAGLGRADMESMELAAVTLQFPDYAHIIRTFERYTDDWTAALNNGFVTPAPGVSASYDEAVAAERHVEAQLNTYLEQVRVELNCRKVQYKHLNKDGYVLDIPANVPLGPQYRLVSKGKYYTARLSDVLLPSLQQAEVAKKAEEEETTRNMFAEFVSYSATWQKAVSALATLDCLCSLADVSEWQQQQGYSVKPTVIDWEEGRGAVLELRESVHPVLLKIGLPGGKTFIPNDIVMGAAHCPARFLLISGPNMGGKSTILRQACIALILGQLGCEVPAQSATFTPVDRIFSRVGAHDEIMRNESTFYVECKEAVHILANASPRSFVIVDELGRGTSTFDGTAIAISVVEELRRMDCLSLFSTHYHMLIDEYTDQPGVALYHMTNKEEDALPFAASTMSPTHSSKAASALLKDVTFLYKFCAGVSSKSFGLNVARMAGVMDEVVREAAEVSAMFERRLMKSHGQGRAAKRMNGDEVKGSVHCGKKAETRGVGTGTGWTAEQTAVLRRALMALNLADAHEQKLGIARVSEAASGQ